MKISRLGHYFKKITSPEAAAWRGEDFRLTRKRKELLGETALQTPVSDMRTRWGLISSFWKSEEKYKAYVLAGATLGLTLGQVYLEALTIPHWSQFFASAMDRNITGIGNETLMLGGLFLSVAAVTGARHYLTQALHMNWRSWLIHQFTDAYTNKQAYYHLGHKADKADNPDLTMTDNIKEYAGNIIGLVEGGFKASVSIVTFMNIMYHMSDKIPTTVLGYNVPMPGYAFWVGFSVALASAAVGTYLKYRLGHKMVDVTEEMLHLEGDFRSNLFDIRTHAEETAFYDGEQVEKERLKNTFARVTRNWYDLMKITARLQMFDDFYQNSSRLFAYGIGAAAYSMSPNMAKGGFSGFAETFDKLRINMSWFVQALPAIFRVQTLNNRITALAQQIDAAQSLEEFYRQDDLPAGVKKVKEKTGAIAINDLNIVNPVTKNSIVKIPQLYIEQGRRIAVVGDSGSGKSTILRALRGLWKYGDGDISMPAGKKLFFAFQVPRILSGQTLKENVCYPGFAAEFTDEQVVRVLTRAGLEEMIPFMHDKERNHKSWTSLSQGEKQRLVFARIFLHKPDIVFLDEATSAMDPALQEKVYETLLEELPDATIVSIAHRRAVMKFHESVARIKDGIVQMMSFDEFQAQDAAAQPQAPKPF